jgi:methyltransferase (TIGR00027 family)
LAARARLAEDTLASAVAAGVRQYVVLGAGLDTFALRNTNPDLRVFEVDYPSTQAWKRERIAERGVAAPSTLTIVPVDFHTQQLGAQLAAAGFDAKAGAYFSWLGVTPYLVESAIWDTLRYIASVAGPHGGVVFDYSADIPRSFFERVIIWFVARRVAKAGEPFRSKLKPANLVVGLRELGFENVQAHDRSTLNPKYFAGRADKFHLVSGNFIVALGATQPTPR